MHPNSLLLMKRLIQKHCQAGRVTRVCDIGSMDVNGSYRGLFDARFEYTGVDITLGKNVDRVIPDNYDWSAIASSSYDLVISGQTLEHMTMPWLAVKEMYRITRFGGLVIVIVPWSWPEHKYPLDCYRYLPDGLDALLGTWAGFSKIESFIDGHDCVFVGKKEK